jgi:pimeloyl-ACP methyl ester carboxylesterase
MEKWMLFKNTKISYTDSGKGAVVVLLHGFLENKHMWKEIIPVISRNKRVLAIDLLGHGHTECLGYIHPMELMADAVAAVLKIVTNSKNYTYWPFNGWLCFVSIIRKKSRND